MGKKQVRAKVEEEMERKAKDEKRNEKRKAKRGGGYRRYRWGLARLGEAKIGKMAGGEGGRGRFKGESAANGM